MWSVIKDAITQLFTAITVLCKASENLAKSVENATQAQLVKGPLTFTSTVYGASANKVAVSFNKNPVSGAYDFHVDYEPKMYSQTYMSIGNLFTIGYDPNLS